MKQGSALWNLMPPLQKTIGSASLCQKIQAVLAFESAKPQ